MPTKSRDEEGLFCPRCKPRARLGTPRQVIADFWHAPCYTCDHSYELEKVNGSGHFRVRGSTTNEEAVRSSINWRTQLVTVPAASVHALGIIGSVSLALRSAGFRQEAQDYRLKCFAAKNSDEVLRISVMYAVFS